MAPELVSELPRVFRESVICSINDILDKRNAGILLALLKGVDLGDQHAVFGALDSLSYRRAPFLEKVISREFYARVRRMVKGSLVGGVSLGSSLSASARA